ncbi:hypothetical protein NC653_005202 [Populus alba x Populus x berolinensis]|uniref:Uncharacterized protein n=1 Tax=Populus alba x Populus x berolinensis TaxID=444605 RepID=A0AAD6WAX5_9ROSI|nr:hypothetical protein NC653_005202 [Populus alba x Populus x berolinensis]
MERKARMQKPGRKEEDFFLCREWSRRKRMGSGKRTPQRFNSTKTETGSTENSPDQETLPKYTPVALRD